MATDKKSNYHGKKQCELIPDNYALFKSRLHSLMKRLNRDPVTLHEYDSIFKKQESKGFIEDSQKNLNPPQLCIFFLTTLLFEMTNQILVCILFKMHLLKRMIPL